jgi:hypothetical protein
MNKTCYFCEHFDECGNVYSDTEPCSDDFKPNADWIEYEKLQKENEKQKQTIEKMKDGVKWLLPYLKDRTALMEEKDDWIEKYEVLKKENEELKKIKDAYEGKIQKTFKVGDIIIPNDWAVGKTNDGKTYFFKLNNGQKVVGKKHNQTRVGGFCYDFVITKIESEVKE